MTGTLATFWSAAFKPSPPRGTIRSTVSLWVASSASSSRPPPATRPTHPSASPAPTAASAAIRTSAAFECSALGGAAQDDRVARLDAQRRRVDRDVRARLIHDRDHAQRHAHLAHIQPIGQAPAIDHLADRVWQRNDLLHRAGDRLDPGLVQHEPVQQRVAQPGFRARLHVAGVGLQDLLRVRDQRPCNRRERRVLAGGVRLRELARGAPGRAADLTHRCRGGSCRRHSHRTSIDRPQSRTR